MRAEIAERAGEQLHHRLVDAENDAQHAAGDARQHRAEADEHTLQEALHKPQRAA